MDIDGKQYKVSDLMRAPVVIQETADLKEALRLLVEKKSNIGCVVDESGSFVGGVTTLDIIRAILPDYLEKDTVAARFADDSMLREDALKASTKEVSEFVNRNEATVRPDANLLEATALSSADNHSRVVVVDEDNKPLGILTRTEIKQVLAAFLGVSDELHDACANGTC